MATIEELQGELVRLSDIRASIDPDDLAGRHACDLEMDKLRHQLKALQKDDLDAARSEWAERAGNKGTHETDVDAAVAESHMPMEGGHAAGGAV